MKNKSLISAFALFALCTVVKIQAANQSVVDDRFSGEVPILQIPAKVCVNGDTVKVGTSRVMVSARLGSPNAVLHDGSWLFSGYMLNLGTTVLKEPRTLVIRFTDSAVSSLTLADKAAVVALRQAPHRSPKDQFLAAVQKR